MAHNEAFPSISPELTLDHSFLGKKRGPGSGLLGITRLRNNPVKKPGPRPPDFALTTEPLARIAKRVQLQACVIAKSGIL